MLNLGMGQYPGQPINSNPPFGITPTSQKGAIAPPMFSGLQGVSAPGQAPSTNKQAPMTNPTTSFPILVRAYKDAHETRFGERDCLFVSTDANDGGARSDALQGAKTMTPALLNNLWSKAATGRKDKHGQVHGKWTWCHNEDIVRHINDIELYGVIRNDEQLSNGKAKVMTGKYRRLLNCDVLGRSVCRNYWQSAEQGSHLFWALVLRKHQSAHRLAQRNPHTTLRGGQVPYVTGTDPVDAQALYLQRKAASMPEGSLEHRRALQHVHEHRAAVARDKSEAGEVCTLELRPVTDADLVRKAWHRHDGDELVRLIYVGQVYLHVGRAQKPTAQMSETACWSFDASDRWVREPPCPPAPESCNSHPPARPCLVSAPQAAHDRHLCARLTRGARSGAHAAPRPGERRTTGPRRSSPACRGSLIKCQYLSRSAVRQSGWPARDGRRWRRSNYTCTCFRFERGCSTGA